MKKKKSTEEQTIDLIKSKGGEILKIEKVGSNQYFHFNCKEGHFLKKEKRKLLYRNQYCNYYPCNEGKKCEWRDEQGFLIFKTRLKEIFGNDVKCIETIPKTSKKFLFKCTNCGEEWRNEPSYQLHTPNSKKKPPSCKKCGGSFPTSKKEIKKILKELGLIALEGIDVIENQQTKFKYQCKKCKYVDIKTLNNLLNSQKNNLGYCDCSFQRTHWDLNKLKKAGQERKFELVETPTNFNTFTLYKWKCAKKGHITSFSIGSLKSGCKDCYLENKFTQINDIKNWLKDNAKHIELVAGQKWKGSNTDYNFKCSKCGKVFSKHLHNLIQYPTCKYRTNRYSEKLVQFYLEKLLGIEFEINKKYKFLKNGKGNPMELDGYNKEHKIAFEHHGIQHYKKTSWHNAKNTLKARKNDDLLKREQCESNGIKLIEIPALFEMTQLSDLKKVIKIELERLKIEIPSNFDEINPNRSELVICK